MSKKLELKVSFVEMADMLFEGCVDRIPTVEGQPYIHMVGLVRLVPTREGTGSLRRSVDDLRMECALIEAQAAADAADEDVPIECALIENQAAREGAACSHPPLMRELDPFANDGAGEVRCRECGKGLSSVIKEG